MVDATSVARVLGAASSSGARFVTPKEFAELAPAANEPPVAGAVAAPVAPHLALHVVGSEIPAALLLAAAERDEGVHGIFLFPAHEPDAAHAPVAETLRAMGHGIGAWLPDATLDAPAEAQQLIASLREGFAEQGVKELDLVAAPGASGERLPALSELAAAAGAPWSDGAAGATFRVRDDGAGWSLTSTALETPWLTVPRDHIARDFVSVVCDAVSRASCIYTLLTDGYG